MSDPYSDRALQLAHQMYTRCERSAGFPILWSANENGLTDPCDALRRLGVMEAHATRPTQEWTPGRTFFEIGVLAYSFRQGREPGRPLPLRRHPGEPSHKVLLRALCNEAWFESLTLRDLGIDLGVGKAETEFIIELIEKRLGTWSPERGFVVGADGAAWQAISNDYWSSRMECAKRLGRESALFPGADVQAP